MKTKLSDLKITPLPWPDDGFEMTPPADATHAELSRTDWEYARHAANNLRKLIEALNRSQKVICKLSGCSKMLDSHTPDCLAAKEAVKSAEEIETQ